MAPEAPDPKTFKSWEEAFAYPIPAVRSMEKHLRRDIESNREKLRTLVGASYRDLLGTAESIIDMDTEMHNVETYMGEIGKRCNTKLLEKKGSNLKAWMENVGASNSARYTLASHLAVLRSCPDVISRLLRSGGSILLAAKVLVISRLLHTKLSQRPKPPPYLEMLRNKLGVLRRRLLNRIDERFKRLDIARDALLEAMCAFSLATSSSAKDVLRHYHHIRQEAISKSMEEKECRHEHLLLALRLYVKTLKDTQAVSPIQLATSLEKLKSTPLMRNPDVYALVELNLDIHEKWIDNDVRTFTPYIRHDDLSKIEAERLLKQWARETFSLFLGGLRNRVENVDDPAAVTHLRKQILDLWLSNHQHSFAVDSAETVDGLRDVFNQQGIRIVQKRASKLAHVGTTILEIIQEWQPGTSDSLPSLWDSSMTSMEMSRGGKAFQESLAARSLGKNGPLSKVCTEYTAFHQSVQAVEAVIKKLREIKWVDDCDEVDNEDDLLDNKQTLLSEDDPSLLQDELRRALAEAYGKLQVTLTELQPNEDDENRSQKSCFLLRTWRELRQHLPQSHQNPELGLDTIHRLQGINAESALHSPLQKCNNRLQKIAKAGTIATRALWEGEPQLPVLPSIWTYRLLLDVTASMTACGSDVWSPQATDLLKKELMVKTAPLIENLPTDQSMKVNGYMNGEADGEQESDEKEEVCGKEETEEHATDALEEAQINGSSINGSIHHDKPVNQSRDISVQTLFDISYLINATTIKDTPAEDNQLISLQQKLSDDLVLDVKLSERIEKDAGEYWKRTSLLFGLLA